MESAHYQISNSTVLAQQFSLKTKKKTWTRCRSGAIFSGALFWIVKKNELYNLGRTTNIVWNFHGNLARSFWDIREQTNKQTNKQTDGHAESKVKTEGPIALGSWHFFFHLMGGPITTTTTTTTTTTNNNNNNNNSNSKYFIIVINNETF